MNRLTHAASRATPRLLIAATLVLGTAYSFACGGGGGEGNTNTMPTTSATPTMTATAMPTETATATASDTAAETASATTPPPAPKSLYERLGGKDAIGKVTDDFFAIVKDDKRINKFFAATLKDKKKTETLRQNVVDFLSKSAGCTDCDYKGKDMKTVHAKMKIKDADFDAFVEDLNKALDKNGVGQTEKDELNTALQGMRGDVVTVQAKPAASAKGAAAPKASK